MIKKSYKKLFKEKTRNTIRQYLSQLISPIYYGHNYTCNCCNKTFRKFLPKGNIKRQNAKCPYCGSLERTRLLLFFLKNKTALFNTEKLRLLHFAPEPCLFKIFNKLNINYIDGDINPSNANHIIDITNIQYPDNYFDIIICSHVLGHVPNEAKAISEIRRVLNPNGIAIIMTLINLEAQETFEDKTITSDSGRLLNYGEPDLCRLHGIDFSERLQTQGFIVTRIDYTKQIHETINETHNLGNGSRELIFKCQK